MRSSFISKSLTLMVITLSLGFISCSNEQDDQTEKIRLKKTEKGYEPVVAPINPDTFQQLFMTGGWSCVKNMAVYADGSIRDKEPLVGGMGIIYMFADGHHVQRLFIVDYPRENTTLSEAEYTYDEKNNTFAEFESSPLLNRWIQYTILSINDEEMVMTKPHSTNNKADYVLEYYVFKHYSNEKVWEILQEERVGFADDEGFVADPSALCQSWQLIGYGNETNFHMIDEAYRKKDERWGNRFYLVFKNDGTFEGRDAVNGLGGSYICNDNQIKISDILSTKIYDDSQESEEFLKRLWNTSSYCIKDNNKLRLYYSKDEFLYFEARK